VQFFVVKAKKTKMERKVNGVVKINGKILCSLLDF
jgi:hypothetical protein